MTFTIDLTASEEAELIAEAEHRGVAPDVLLKQIVTNYLPKKENATFAEILVPVHEYSRQQGCTEDELDEFVETKVAAYRAERHKEREQNKTAREPIKSDAELFAQWSEEDARLTPEDQAENNRIYAEIERNGIARVQL